MAQVGIVHQAVVLQESHGLRHLLQVEFFGPIRVTDPFSLGQFLLNVDQELVGALGLGRGFGLLFLRGMQTLPGSAAE